MRSLALSFAVLACLAGIQAAHRLFLGCDGPRKTTLALYNLAEIRLRRGRLAGVRSLHRLCADRHCRHRADVLERATRCRSWFCAGTLNRER